MKITMDKKMLLYESIQRAIEDKHRRISYVEAEALFDSLLSVIKGHLLQGHKIFLCHIGTLSTKDMMERTVRDPITHQLHTVPARTARLLAHIKKAQARIEGASTKFVGQGRLPYSPGQHTAPALHGRSRLKSASRA